MRIISKTPLRISFVGGGTDIAWFYQRHGGEVISTAIDKYVTVKVGARERGSEEARDHEIRYSTRCGDWHHDVRYADGVAEIEHPIVRECLRKVGIDGGVSIEIESDARAGTGLGSSSALTVGLLNALVAFKSDMTPYKEFIAEAACEIEIERLGNPIGKQDQYAATYLSVRFSSRHRVKRRCLLIS